MKINTYRMILSSLKDIDCNKNLDLRNAKRKDKYASNRPLNYSVILNCHIDICILIVSGFLII